MSEITDVFEEMLDAQEEATGERITATVGGVTADCLLGMLTHDSVLVDGGTAEGGDLTIQMRVADFTERPAKYATVEVEGETLAVLQVEESHGIYSITAIDPANL